MVSFLKIFNIVFFLTDHELNSSSTCVGDRLHKGQRESLKSNYWIISESYLVFSIHGWDLLGDFDLSSWMTWSQSNAADWNYCQISITGYHRSTLILIWFSRIGVSSAIRYTSIDVNHVFRWECHPGIHFTLFEKLCVFNW